MRRQNQILLMDGPLAGVCHELHAGYPPPEALALPEGKVLHWYRVDADNKAFFLRTEAQK